MTGHMKTAHIIGVGGGSGWVGASALTAAIAYAVHRRAFARSLWTATGWAGDSMSPSASNRSAVCAGLIWPVLGGHVDGPGLLARMSSAEGVRILSFSCPRDVPL